MPESPNADTDRRRSDTDWRNRAEKAERERDAAERERDALRRDGVAVARGHLEQQLARVLDRPTVVPDVQRFVAHLDREWGALFGFLRAPAVDATNWRAEQPFVRR